MNLLLLEPNNSSVNQSNNDKCVAIMNHACTNTRISPHINLDFKIINTVCMKNNLINLLLIELSPSSK